MLKEIIGHQFFFSKTFKIFNKQIDNFKYCCSHRLQKNIVQQKYCKTSTVKPVYNGHPRETKIEAVVYRWLLFRGNIYYNN